MKGNTLGLNLPQGISKVPKLIRLFLCFLCFQFTLWIDAVIFVFSLENEASFNAIYNYYTKMSHYRNAAEIPIILVGTQGNVPCPTIDLSVKNVAEIPIILAGTQGTV